MLSETEIEVLRERLQEYRAQLEASYYVIKNPTPEAVENYFKKLEEHGIIAPRENTDGKSNDNNRG